MRKPLSLWISYDEMKSWGKKIVLCDEPMFYPHAFLDNEKQMVYLASENARTQFSDEDTLCRVGEGVRVNG